VGDMDADPWSDLGQPCYEDVMFETSFSSETVRWCIIGVRK